MGDTVAGENQGVKGGSSSSFYNRLQAWILQESGLSI